MAEAAAAFSPAGLVLGAYRPLRPLGSGGNGSVWLARHEPTGLDVALKIVPREGRAGLRAEREATTAARLRHPHTMRAYALGRDPSHVYIAYEYVPGRTLREVMREGTLRDGELLEAAAQILDGLAHAHAHGIVHRDVKPSNVLLAHGQGIHVKILDFGLARTEDGETLTGVGDVPGTLAYISPERLRGEKGGPACDVWAAGVLLWEGLAGRHPFWQGSLLETARLIKEGAPSLATVRPELPRPLVALVDRALDVDPRRRPPAAKLAAALRGSPRRRAAAPAPLRAPAIALRRPPLGRVLTAGLAALAAAWTTTALPFFPAGWPAGLALVAAALALWRERAALALVLALPVLPLGNLAAGAALLYAPAAVALLLLCRRTPRAALLLVLAPPLAAVGALALAPLGLLGVPGRARRAALAAAAPLVAALARNDLGLDVAGQGAGGVAQALAAGLAHHPGVPLTAAVLAVAALAAPAVRGVWPAALWGAALLAGTVLAAPGGANAQAAWAWAAALALAAAGHRGVLVGSLRGRMRLKS